MAIVTHEMGFAREVADRVLFLDDGQLVEEPPLPRSFLHQKVNVHNFLEKILWLN